MHFPQPFLLIFISLMFLSSVDQHMRINESERGGLSWDWKGKKKSSVCPSMLFGFPLVFLHPKESMAKGRHWSLAVQTTSAWYGARETLPIPDYTGQFCHSAMQNNLNIHGIHTNNMWLSHWTMGISDHPRYCSVLKSFGPYSWKLEPVRWTNRHYSNDNEPQRMKELKSQAPF